LLAGLGILTMTLFPFALPGLLLALLLALPLLPLVLVAVAALLLLRVIRVPLRLARAFVSGPGRGLPGHQPSDNGHVVEAGRPGPASAATIRGPEPT
jgi:hypothetical protein